MTKRLWVCLLVLLAAACRVSVGLEPTATLPPATQPTSTVLVPSETPPAAATPTPPLVVTPTGTPPALRFTADQPDVAPGETLTLRWSTDAVVSGTVSI